ncbi:MAG: hypothetical protein AAF489_17050 [Bacteroidota bacterium]
MLITLISCKRTTQESNAILDQILAGEKNWLSNENLSTGNVNESLVIAQFNLRNNGEVLLLDLSDSLQKPNVGVVYVQPKVNREKGPKFHLVSPLEIFLTLQKGNEPPPKKLKEHHLYLAKLGIFDPTPRIELSLPWLINNLNDPDVEFGTVGICAGGSFSSNWSWFSTWHGEENNWSIERLSTGWGVNTGFSEPRAAAICLIDDDNLNDSNALARYRILNRNSGGSWETIYESGWMDRGEGVGFQTYGPGRGETRIRITTSENNRYYFFVGASWTESINWIISGL